MSGVAFTFDVQGLNAVGRWLHGMETLPKQELLDSLSQLGQEQTRRRIASEKSSPEGRAWKANHEGTSILFKTGSHLWDSIDHSATQTEARWGSGWIGARVHQFGATIVPVKADKLAFTVGGKKVFAKKVVIPARPYLGMSAANETEMEQAGVRFIMEHGG